VFHSSVDQPVMVEGLHVRSKSRRMESSKTHFYGIYTCPEIGATILLWPPIVMHSP